MSKRAWVTLATNDSYGLGALVLAHSLRRAESSYPAVVLITPAVTDVMRDRLSAVFAEVITVDVLDSRDAAHLALLRRPELGITFTKIHCWSLTQYDKCVFLDADALVVQNCDELFDREELSAAPDVGWPDCFNSGVFVYVPSSDTYSKLIEFAQDRGSFDGGDQGLLNSFFSDWAHGDISKHLPFLYNVTSAAFYSYIPALKHYGQNLKIIHFIGATKPWLQQFNWDTRTVDAPDHLRELLQLWWDIFVGLVHTKLDVNMETTVVVEEQPRSPSPVLPPEDNQNYYEPASDPQSEFSWHHPDQQNEQSESDNKLDMSQFYDPWQQYRANVPQQTYQYSGNQNVEDSKSHQEIHLHSQFHPHDHSNLYQQIAWQQNQYHQERSHNWHQQSSQDHHHEQHSHYNSTHNQNQHYHHSHQDSHHSHTHNSYQGNTQHSHNHTHTYDTPLQIEIPCDHNSHQHSHNNELNENGTHSTLGQHDHSFKTLNTHTIKPLRTQYVYYLHMDSRRNRRNREPNCLPVIPEGTTNGNTHDSDDDYEDFRPRHPYDGFYLRHKATIDPRGRKICTHEIPPTPINSPSRTRQDLPHINDIDSTEEYETASDEEDNTGVAGNLARVVPGSTSYQHEAIDELTRRQGWEAGNIDYMGADSFDNIWAKISQTLNQTQISQPKQPSPPREEPTLPLEPSPPKTIAPVEAPTLAPETRKPVEVPPPVASVEAPEPVEIAKPVESVQPTSTPQEVPKPAKTEPIVPPTPPATPKSTPEASTPVSEVPPPISASPKANPSPVQGETTPQKDANTSTMTTASADSPPLVNTPSKEELPAAPDTKSEERERRKPAERLRLSTGAAASAAAAAQPTPDSELEDAASLARAIIASELRTTLTSPSPSTDPATAASPILQQQQLLSVEEPQVPTPPVSLAQIGVKTKAKPTIAAQIESSLTEKEEPSTPSTPSTPTSEPSTPTDAPKKKVVKKVVKKEGPRGDGSTPVPPPRKKEKKPKEK